MKAEQAEERKQSWEQINRFVTEIISYVDVLKTRGSVRFIFSNLPSSMTVPFSRGLWTPKSVESNLVKD